MLKLTIIEFFLRTIPESFILMWALFILCNVKFKLKSYVISSVLMGMCQYFIRRLPINYGVNTILGIFVMIFIMSQLNKSEIIPAIKFSLIVTIGLFVSEWINILIINIMFKDLMEMIMQSSILKTIAGIPSLIFFTFIVWVYRLRKRRREISEN